MSFRRDLAGMVVALCLAVLPLRSAAQATDPAEAVARLAQYEKFLEQIDNLHRMTEELAFWQGVAVMGAEYGWELDYNTAGTERVPYTYRLFNALDETEIAAVRATQALARNQVASKEDKARAADVHAGYLEMRAAAQSVYDLILAGDVAAAATVYEQRTIPLRRNSANQSYSAAAMVRKRIAKTALDVRLGR